MAEEQATAEVLEQDGPTVNPEEHATAAAETAGDKRDPQGTANEGEEEQKKRLGGWQRKIVKLERENEALRDLALRRDPKESAKSVAAEEDKAPVKPDIRHFDGTQGKTLEDYEAARDTYYENLAEYKAKLAVRAAQQQSEQKSERERLQTGFAKQCDTLRKEHADFDEVAFAEDVIATPHMLQAMIESDLGAKLAYFLGSHPEEAERISKFSPNGQAREMGKLEASLSQTSTPAPASGKDKETAERARETQAPAPPQPVKRTSAADNGELRDDLPPDEWAKRFVKKMEKAK